MDPEFIDVLAVFPPLQFADPAAQRAAFAALPEQEAPPWPKLVRRDDLTVVGPDGHVVPVRRYTPDQPTRSGAVVWIHGGGYCVGTPAEDEYFCAYLARDVGTQVLSVDYRLAPEDPFPAGLEDCYAVVRAAAEGSLAAAGPVVVAGASAGAGLAAAVALRSRDEEGPALAGQLLIFPFLDATMSTASYRQHADGPVFTAVDANNCWNHYLGDTRLDPPLYGSPSAHPDLSGLPRSYVVAAGADPLRDEAVDYALRLQSAGVPTDLQLVADVPHGFSALLPSAKASRRVRAAIVNALTQMIDNGKDSG